MASERSSPAARSPVPEARIYRRVVRRRPRRPGPKGTLGLVTLVITILIGATIFGGLNWTRPAGSLLESSLFSGLDAVGLGSVEQAEHSLATGQGPAAG